MGTLMFMPLIYPFEPWRIKHNHHHAHTNKCAIGVSAALLLLNGQRRLQRWQVVSVSPAWFAVSSAVADTVLWLGVVVTLDSVRNMLAPYVTACGGVRRRETVLGPQTPFQASRFARLLLARSSRAPAQIKQAAWETRHGELMRACGGAGWSRTPRGTPSPRRRWRSGAPRRPSCTRPFWARRSSCGPASATGSSGTSTWTCTLRSSGRGCAPAPRLG